MEQEKEIRWLGTAYQDILEFPSDFRKEACFQLGKIQAGLDPDDWKPFEGIGPGTKEIRIREISGIYRVIYVAIFEEAIYVLRRFQEKTENYNKTRYGCCWDTLPSHYCRKKEQEMTIETEINHVTRPGANLFLELGFQPDEAARLHRESKQRISDTRVLKEQLMEELTKWILENHLKQAEASNI